MGANKALHNAGDPLDTSSETIKRGLKGSDFGIHADKVGGRHDGHPDVNTGDAGVEVDKRTILDSDRRPLGTDYAIGAPSTFTVAAGAGAAGTFEATAANEAGSVEVVVFRVNATDTDVDGDLIDKFDISGTGAAESIALGSALANTLVAVYARRLTTDEVPGPFFGTRRTVTTRP